MSTTTYAARMRRACLVSAMFVFMLIGVAVTARPASATAPLPAAQYSPVYTTAVPPTPVAPTEYSNDQRVIHGSKIVNGGDFTLSSDEVLQGDLTVFGGNVLLEEGSRVEGNVSVFGGYLDAYGTITRDLAQIGGTLHLRSTVRVLGRQSVLGGSTIRDAGAYVANQDTAPDGAHWNWQPTVQGPLQKLLDVVGGFVATVAGIIAITMLSIAIMALFPSNVAQMVGTARKQWLASGSIGLLSFIAIPIVLLVCVVLICTIPVAIVLALVWALAILVGWAVVARILGERLAIGLSLRSWSPIAQMALGALVLGILGALPIVGWLVGFLATIVGLGALILTRAGTHTYPSVYTVTQLPTAPLPPPAS